MMGSWCLCLVLPALCVSVDITTLTKDSERPGSITQRCTERPLTSHELGPGEYTCGEGYCRCNDTFADCSHHDGKLTYVPQLPETILKLDFSRNNVDRVVDVNFFHNVANITWLDFSRNILADISPEALSRLKHLEYLDLTFNILTEISPKALSPLKHLKYLFLGGNELSEISPAILSPLKQLLCLDLSFNRLSEIRPEALSSLKHLQHLDLSWNGNITGISPEALNSLKDLEYMDLSGNRLSEISFEALSPLRYLVHLGLSYSILSNTSLAAVQSLKHLQYLHLSCITHCTYTTLAPVFSLATLRVLDVSFCGLGALPDNLCPLQPTSQIEILDLSNNQIASFNMTTLKLLVNLKSLNAGYNSIYLGLVTDYLPRLEILTLNGNRLNEFPKTCDERDVSLFPSLQVMDLSDNLIGSFQFDSICLPKLNILFLDRNRVLDLNPYDFSQQRFPVLNELHLSETYFFADDHFFSNSKLEILDLSENGFYLSDMPAATFEGCDNLLHLDVSSNRLDYTSFSQVFGNMTKLQYLDLGNTHLEHISAHTFSNFRSLTELRLNDNRLGNLPAGAFDNLPNLSKLLLQSNKISVVSPDTFGADTRRRLRQLDISDNPFSCSCDVMWFREWLKANHSLFFQWQSWIDKKYMCANIPDMSVQSFYMPDQACLLSREASSFIIYTIALLISSFTLVVNLYSFRWHIRLVLYEAFRGRGERWRHLQEGHFLYDVFVCHDSEDVDWVFEHLVPELEERMGLRLCLHERDFIPGKHIVNNIADCAEASKKVLMVFSTNFAHSQWCQFELNYCLRHVMDYDDALVVVMLHDVPARDLTTAMMAVMKTTTYIEWDDTPDARAAFWGRLRIAFREIMPDTEHVF